MKEKKTNDLGEIASYYTQKLRKFGPNPEGVDWKDEDAQNKRFEQLTRILNQATPDFSVNELGCGYGALLTHLQRNFPLLGSYSGVDISRDMVLTAQNNFGELRKSEFREGSRLQRVADYSFASGVFNVKLSSTDDAWESHVWESIENLSEHSRIGFAINFLTCHSDRKRMDKNLYYPDPSEILKKIIQNFSRDVELIHGHGVFQFTILVSKERS